MAALFAEEVVEAIRYVDDPDFYLTGEDCDVVLGADGKVDWGKSHIWLGAADDTILRKRGVEFVDGSAPGFAAIVGAAPTKEIAKDICEEYQRRNLYVFLAANQAGTTVTEQLCESGVQVGWGHPSGAVRPGHLRRGVRAWLRQPRRHGLRRRQPRRLPPQPDL